MKRAHKIGPGRANGKVWQLSGISSSLAMLFSSTVGAFPFQLTDHVSGSFDSTLSYGVQQRMSSRNCHLIGQDNGGCSPDHAQLADAQADASNINMDDGDLNYNKHDIVSSVIKGVHDLSLKHDTWGLSTLVRWSEQYDFKAGDTRRTDLTDAADDMATHDMRMLDVWVQKDFTWFDQSAIVKVGNQAVAWGEAILTPGGVNVTNAIDVRRSHTPGTQLKEIYRPAPMVLLNTDINEKLSFEGYYQWHWNEYEFDAPGTYWSTADIIGKGHEHNLYIPTSTVNQQIRSTLPPYGERLVGQAPPGTLGDRGSTGLSEAQMRNPADVLPRVAQGLGRPLWFTGAIYGAAGGALPYQGTHEGKDSGQYGLSLRYSPEWYSGSFRAYYVRYNEKIPAVSYHVNQALSRANPASAGYSIDYANDREMFGLSTNTELGNWAVGAELAYQPKAMTQIDPSVPLAVSVAAKPKAENYACVNGGGEAKGKYCKGWVDEKRYQLTLNALQIMQPHTGVGKLFLDTLGASEGQFLFEAAFIDYPDMDPDGGIPYQLPSYDSVDKFSWGYTLDITTTYPNAFKTGWSLAPELAITHGVHGNSPNTLPFQAHAIAAGASLGIISPSGDWEHSLGYTAFTGGKRYNVNSDRDFLSYSVTYSF